MTDLVIQWFKDALSKEDVTPFDKLQLNGHAANPHVWDAIEGLRMARDGAGVGQKAKAANEAWQTFTKSTVPEIQARLEASRYLIPASELKNLPPVNWLIDGIIPERGLSVMYGDPKSGKSFWALDVAERVAMRRPVLYIAAEGDSGYQYRHDAWLKHNKIKKEPLLTFWVKPVRMMYPQDVELFASIAEDIQPHLIIVDTLARCMAGGDENSQKDMNQFVESCDLFRDRLKAAVLVLHHTNKSGDIRGSTVLLGAADSVFELKPRDGKIEVQCEYIKDSRPFEKQVLQKIEIPLTPGHSSCVLIPANSAKSNPEELTKNQSSLLEWLAKSAFDRGARTNDLISAVGMAKQSFYDAISSLTDRGFVIKDGRYDPWILTAYGKEMARKHGYLKSAAFK